jgi:hypothetical protein
MTFHLSAIRKWFRAGAATAVLGFALAQAPGFAQVSPQGQWFYVEYNAGEQTVNGPQPSLPRAETLGGFRIDYVAIQCIQCAQAWHMQLYTRMSTVVHSTGFMLIPTSLGGVNYGAASVPASIYVEQGSNWELLFSSGGVSTTTVPQGVHVEISGHIEAVGPLSGSLYPNPKFGPALRLFQSVSGKIAIAGDLPRSGPLAPAGEAAGGVYDSSFSAPHAADSR